MLRKYLVVFENGQSTIYWAENWRHAKEQGENAEPSLEIVVVYYLHLSWSRKPEDVAV